MMNPCRVDRRISIFLLALALTGCPQRSAMNPPVSPLYPIWRGLDRAKVVAFEGATAIIELDQQGLLDKQLSLTILDAIQRAAKGGVVATDAVAKMNALGEAERKLLRNLLQPMADAINEALARHVVNVGDAAREKVKAALVAIQTAIASVQTLLEVTACGYNTPDDARAGIQTTVSGHGRQSLYRGPPAWRIGPRGACYWLAMTGRTMGQTNRAGEVTT